MSSFLISGANRGLGFALLERLAQDESRVFFAGARDPTSAKALNDLAAKSNGRVHVLQLDPTSQESVDAAIKIVEEKQGSLDVLINNAGTMAGGFDGADKLDYEALRSNFDVNVIGVARLTDAALPLLRKGDTRQIFTISSIMGSGSWTKNMGMSLGAAYGPTKSAATLLSFHYALALKSEGFAVKSLHPGWVKTDMGGEHADITIDVSIDGMTKTIESTTKEDEIALYSYDGSKLAL